jgi:peptidoglycan-associated lipoprotein
MLTTRIAAGSITALLLASPALAQQTQRGTVELGLFGQYTEFDERFRMDSNIGIGGRIGVFLSRRFALEGDAAYGKISHNGEPFRAGAAPRNRTGTTVQDGPDFTYTPLYFRLAYNIPVGNRSQLILGAHTMRHDYDFTYEVGYGGLLGLRAGITPSLAFRIDALYDWNKTETCVSEVVEACTATTPPAQADRDYADMTLAGRVGLSLMLNTRRPTPPPPPPVVVEEPAPAPAPAPAPVEPPPPPPAPVEVDRTADVRAAVMEMIYFDFDRSDLRPEAQAALDRKIPLFQTNADMRIRIAGHADSRGSDEYNVALSQRRAQAAKAYLVQRGIAENRIEIVGYGEERPAVPNATTDAEHQQNRRDEFEIIAGGPTFRMP